MASFTRTIDAEELLAQAGWVRAVVRRLVLDEAQAEDLLQDTWVAALERPAEGNERGGLRAWLAAVARNLALRRRRREALRRVVEHAAARPEPIEGGQGGVERMQLQRALADAVLALDEPYRAAVILRHLDGLSASEIARRQGCSSAAARQRVSRGLAQLRARLAGRFDRDANGCLALVPLLGRAWSAGTVTGGMVVSTKLTVGVACVALAALALWLTTAGDDGRATVLEAARPTEALAGPRTASELWPDASQTLTAPASVPEVATEEGRRVQLERAAAQAGPGKRALRGRITDTSGRPLGDAVLRLTGEAQPFEVKSDADGNLSAELDFALRAETPELHASCEGYVPRELRLDLGLPFVIELQALPVLAGRVLDPEGRPVAPPGYVKARVIDALTREIRASEVELAPDGSYRLERLPLGRLVLLEARARGFGAAEQAQDLALEPDLEHALDLVLEGGAVVTGTVLDRRTREPVPGAAVWLETFDPEPGSVHPVTTANEQGRFRLEGATEDVSFQDGRRVVFFQLVARAEGYVSSPANGYSALANDEHVYDFEMLLEPAGCSLRVEAVLADGRPARGATVWAIDAQSNPFFETADEHGVHVFENLPAGTFGLWLASQETFEPTGKPGVYSIEREQSLRVDLELAPGEVRTEVLVLRPLGAASLEGRAVDVQGQGVPDFAVRCQLNFQLGNLMLASGWDELRTDADGRYRFEGLHAGKYQVWASGEGTAMACAQPASTYVDVVADQLTTVESLVVGACLTIEGRVAAEGLELASLELTARDPASGAELARTHPSPDGSFRFEPLVSRDYEIVLQRGDEELDRATIGFANASGLFLRAR